MGLTIQLLVFIAGVSITTGLSFRFNKTAYKLMIQPRSAPLPSEVINNSKDSNTSDNKYNQMQLAYNSQQNRLYRNAVNLAKDAKNTNGFARIESTCFHCQNVGTDKIACFTDCITDNLGVFQDLSASISNTIDVFFCKPIGFKFLEEYFTNPATMIFAKFSEFYREFSKNLDSLSTRNLIEIWLSNVLLLQQSPLFFHSFVRANMFNTIIDTDTYEKTQIEEVEKLAPGPFAALCESTFATDIAPDIYNLITAAKGKTHVFDVIFRGLFTIRSAAYYAPGPAYEALSSGILEVLGAIIGQKCDIIGSATGVKSDCDEQGRLPILNFPIPRPVLLGLNIKCD